MNLNLTIPDSEINALGAVRKNYSFQKMMKKKSKPKKICHPLVSKTEFILLIPNINQLKEICYELRKLRIIIPCLIFYIEKVVLDCN